MGDKTAESLARDPKALDSFLASDFAKADVFIRNYGLIRFAFWTDEDCLDMTSSTPAHDWQPLRSTFERYEFGSLLKESAWEKFTKTFETLWGNNS